MDLIIGDCRTLIYMSSRVTLTKILIFNNYFVLLFFFFVIIEQRSPI